jgi:hypothetical protein
MGSRCAAGFDRYWRAQAGERNGEGGPTQAIRNRHWQSPGRYHASLALRPRRRSPQGNGNSEYSSLASSREGGRWAATYLRGDAVLDVNVDT